MTAGTLTLERRRARWAWAFLAVPIVFYVVIRFYPTLNAFLISFTDWNLVGQKTYVGIENYLRLAQDPVFWKVLVNTLLYGGIGLPVSIVFSFVVAYYLDQVRFMHGFLRALYFIPFLTTAAAMGWVWRWFYQPVPVGIFNLILVEFGFGQQPFLRSTTQSLPAVLSSLSITIWRCADSSTKWVALA